MWTTVVGVINETKRNKKKKGKGKEEEGVRNARRESSVTATWTTK